MMIMIIIIVKGARTQQREQRAAVAGSVARDWWSLRRSCRGCHDSGPTQSGNSKGNGNGNSISGTCINLESEWEATGESSSWTHDYASNGGLDILATASNNENSNHNTNNSNNNDTTTTNNNNHL